MKTSFYLPALLFRLFFVSELVAAQIVPTNYIRRKAYTNESGTSFIQSTVYYNDDGKKEQTVDKGLTPDGRDLVHIIGYDVLGRENRTYYPLSNAGSGTAINSEGGVSQLNALYPGEHPFTETTYEFSSLDRTLSVLGPGKAWCDNNKTVSTDYRHNSSSGVYSCGYFYLSGDNIIRNGFYPDNLLYITTSTDENGHITYTFSDKMNRTVLERQKLSDVVFCDTYYLYNSFGLLVYVLPPGSSEQMSANGTYSPTHEAIRNYAYQYEYDSLLRQVSLTIPGCAASYTLYDAGWRPALNQTGDQRLRNEWSYICYDNQSRIIEEGTFVTTSSKENLTTTLSTLYDISTLVSGNSVWLKRNYYDSYAFLTASEVELNYDARPGYGIRYVNTQGGVDLGAKGQLCGTRIRALSTDGSSAPVQTSTFYYDIHGRMIQEKSNTLPDGYDKVYFQYNFSGHPTLQLLEHTTLNRGNIIERYRYEYDQVEREIRRYYQLNGGVEILHCETTYTDLGQVKEERLHNNTEQVSYTYNLRGWLENTKSIRTSDHRMDFEQELFYASTPVSGGQINYNGNISAFRWRCGNESPLRGYGFVYDGLNRLTGSSYGEGTSLSVNTGRYNESQSYDSMGNILSILRTGRLLDGHFGPIDNLTMTYNGNQLTQVTDNALNSVYPGGFEFKDGANQTTEYFYDTNGNLTKDLNKKISNIQYNYLNLPSRIQFEDGSTIDNLYGADGTKLRTIHHLGGTTTVTDYCGNVIYENGSPKTILTEVGFISLNDNKYHYYLQDHQGNNRLVVDQNGTIEEVNHYYPFGGIFESTASVQPYKYNGKELDRSKGLDWYDYGARQYDAVLGRWHSIDPMSEKYYMMSTYNYCGNEPIARIDPNGNDIWVIISANGTFKIIGGERNEDLNIYSTDKNGKRTDNVVGKTLTAYSFFGDDGKVIKDAIINPNDQSGQKFIDDEIISQNPNILSYMPNAVGGKKYDFKTRDIEKRSEGMTKTQYKYRGMPFKNADGETVYASARDIGNYGAGYIAGKTGLDWSSARMGFDALESYQNSRLSTEGMTTQRAERLGYNAGTQKYGLKSVNNWIKRLFNFPTSQPKGYLGL